MNKKQQHTYSRHLLLDEIGVEGQQRLCNAQVAIVGLGGLGCPVAIYLAACGVGTLHLIDGDHVDQSNLHRQTLFGERYIGRSKVVCAAEELTGKYPDQNFVSHPENVTPVNALELLSPVDLVIDCTDNFPSRYLINDTCIKLNTPFVYGALHKFEGQVAVFNFSDGPTYRCLFPDFPKEANQPNCNDVGVLGVLPGIIGTMQALEAIKVIVGMDGILAGELLTYHALRQETRKFKLPKRNNEVCARILEKPLELIPLPICETVHEVSWDELQNVAQFSQIIDVREEHETPKSPDFISHRIPLTTLHLKQKELDPIIPTAILCQRGERSRKAALLLDNEYGFSYVVSIRGGIEKLTPKNRNSL